MLQESLERHLAATGVVGAAVGVLEQGKVEVACAGWSDREQRLPVRPETQFQIASVTKPMVATAIVQLAAAGSLYLDRPITAYVPELPAGSWWDRVTVDLLLANRAGVPLTRAVEFAFEASGDDALARLAAAVADERPLFEPGERWCYSNTAWSLLGRAIETVCACTWEEAMRQLLVAPAGLRDTTFIDEGLLDGAALCYAHRNEEIAPVAPWRSRALGPGGTTMWSSVLDLLRFAGLHLDDGRAGDGRALVAPGTLAALREPTTSLTIPDFMDGWCRGFAYWDWAGGRLYGWDGVTAGHRAILKLIPHRHAAVAFVANSDRGRELYRALFPEILDDRFDITMRPFDRQPVDAPRLDLAAYAGTYAWPDVVFEVVADGDRLHVSAPEGTTHASPIDARTFLFDPEHPDFPILVFADFDSKGCPQTLYYAPWAYPRITGPEPIRV